MLPSPYAHVQNMMPPAASIFRKADSATCSFKQPLMQRQKLRQHAGLQKGILRAYPDFARPHTQRWLHPLLLHPHNDTAMKAILSSPTTPRFQTSDDEDDRKTQIAFYFFAGLLVLALLYFVVLTFFL